MCCSTTGTISRFAPPLKVRPHVINSRAAARGIMRTNITIAFAIAMLSYGGALALIASAWLAGALR